MTKAEGKEGKTVSWCGADVVEASSPAEVRWKVVDQCVSVGRACRFTTHVLFVCGCHHDFSPSLSPLRPPLLPVAFIGRLAARPLVSSRWLMKTSFPEEKFLAPLAGRTVLDFIKAEVVHVPHLFFFCPEVLKGTKKSLNGETSQRSFALCEKISPTNCPAVSGEFWDFYFTPAMAGLEPMTLLESPYLWLVTYLMNINK